MRRRIVALAAAGLLATTGLTACGDDARSTGSTGGSGGGAANPEIGVILPDSRSSARWTTADGRYLEAAFTSAGVGYDIRNAQNDKNAFQEIADEMIASGVKVLMIVNLDSVTGRAVLDKARARGVETIDYDRLTLGGSASYYVSFDNVAVGRLQGEGLVRCLAAKKAVTPVVAYLNGSPTDNNATLFKEGYDGVLKPRFDTGEYVKGPDQAVPEWDNAQAGTIFEQMMTTGTGIDGVLAANDGLANAALTVLRKRSLNGTVPVTGQDATVQGLRNVLTGDQCMTVYKAVRKEADAAAGLAIALARGEKKETGRTLRDPEGHRDVPAVLLDPQAITKENVKAVVDDGYVSRDDLCAAEFAATCAEAGI